MIPRVQGVVLAGGRGRRYGADKVLVAARPGGLSMLEVALEALRPHCDALCVVRADPLPDPLEQRVDRLVDGRRGPLHALAQAFEERPAHRWLVAAADMPALESSTFEPLQEALGAADVACYGGVRGLDPLVAAFTPPAARTLVRRSRAAPRISLREVLGALQLAVVRPGEAQREQLCNVNRPEDLQRAPRPRSTPAPEEG